jgi:carboxymethylenebutenolidase
VRALAVVYGGMPYAMIAKVKRLPPVLELHGDADQSVPLARGVELVRLAKTIGASAEQVTYPGREHGFDSSPTDPNSVDAAARVVRFLRANLKAR